MRGSLASRRIRAAVAAVALGPIAGAGCGSASPSRPAATRTVPAAAASTTTRDPVTTPGPTTPTVEPGSARDPGVYDFAGDSSAATNPDLAGTVIEFTWAELEPRQGTYDWSRIWRAAAPWRLAGKAVILRVITSGQASWGDAGSTPAWVYGLGVPSVDEKDGSRIPEYWDPAYLSAYRAFVDALAGQVGPAPWVSLVEAGVGMGGETLPDTEDSSARDSLWARVGYTDQLWLSTVEQIAGFYGTAFGPHRIAVLVDETFFDGRPDLRERLVGLLASEGYVLQYDGLEPGTRLPGAWSGAVIALEARDRGGDVAGEVSAALAAGATYLLLYQSDLVLPANQAAVARAEKALTGRG